MVIDHFGDVVIFTLYSTYFQRIQLMKSFIHQKIQADWWTKSFAGFVLGFILSLLCASIITIFAFKTLSPGLAPQFGMWSIPWIWLPLCFIAFFIPKGWQAIAIYSSLIVLAYAILCGLRGF